jgi:hypothetical protein
MQQDAEFFLRFALQAGKRAFLPSRPPPGKSQQAAKGSPGLSSRRYTSRLS